MSLTIPTAVSLDTTTHTHRYKLASIIHVASERENAALTIASIMSYVKHYGMADSNREQLGRPSLLTNYRSGNNIALGSLSIHWACTYCH